MTGTVAHLALAAFFLAAAAVAAEAPISLADPSGQGMHLEKLDLRLAAHGPLALTEIEMVFQPSAAWDAGLRPKDLLLQVDGTTLQGLAIEAGRARRRPSWSEPDQRS